MLAEAVLRVKLKNFGLNSIWINCLNFDFHF